jgi:hypothetical protein
MAPRHIHRLKIAGLTLALWILYFAPWPDWPWIEPLRPTSTALAFVIMAWWLGVDSWPLTIVFCVSFFFVDFLMTYVRDFGPSGELSKEPPEAQGMMLYLNMVVFSPVTLWGPALFGASAYAMLRKIRSVRIGAKV